MPIDTSTDARGRVLLSEGLASLMGEQLRNNSTVRRICTPVTSTLKQLMYVIRNGNDTIPAPSGNVSAPVLHGKLRIGSDVESYEVGVNVASRKWYRNGVEIAGQSAASYTLTAADRDAWITMGYRIGAAAEVQTPAVGPVEQDLQGGDVSFSNGTYLPTVLETDIVEVSEELLQDSEDRFGQEVIARLAEELATKMDRAYTHGQGTIQGLIAGATKNHIAATKEEEITQLKNPLKITDAMTLRLRPAVRQRAVFLSNAMTFLQMQEVSARVFIKGPAHDNGMLPLDGQSWGILDDLPGVVSYNNNNNPSATVTGAAPIIAGDFANGYRIVDTDPPHLMMLEGSEYRKRRMVAFQMAVSTIGRVVGPYRTFAVAK